VYIGWLLHRIPGGLLADTLVILPGYVSLMVLSWLHAAYDEIGFVQALFFGLKAAVLAIVVEAVFKVGHRALKNRVMIGVTALSFVAIFFFFHVPFPLIILAAAFIGFVGNAAGYKAFSGSLGHRGADGNAETSAAIDHAFFEQIPDHVRPSWTRAIKVTEQLRVTAAGRSPFPRSVCTHPTSSSSIARFSIKRQDGVCDRDRSGARRKVVRRQRAWPGVVHARRVRPD
jgi:chromate transport protein ChrA